MRCTRWHDRHQSVHGQELLPIDEGAHHTTSLSRRRTSRLAERVLGRSASFVPRQNSWNICSILTTRQRRRLMQMRNAMPTPRNAVWQSEPTPDSWAETFTASLAFSCSSSPEVPTVPHLHAHVVLVGQVQQMCKFSTFDLSTIKSQSEACGRQAVATTSSSLWAGILKVRHRCLQKSGGNYITTQ